MPTKKVLLVRTAESIIEVNCELFVSFFLLCINVLYARVYLCFVVQFCVFTSTIYATLYDIESYIQCASIFFIIISVVSFGHLHSLICT
jgi:hypothetical protein